MGGRQGDKKVPRGNRGEQVFAEVEQLTTGSAMTRRAAFEAIAKRTGAQPGTEAANYYRLAKNAARRFERGEPATSGSEVRRHRLQRWRLYSSGSRWC